MVGRNPPTKLINAWAAGCIPVVVQSQSYDGLFVPGLDALVASSWGQLPGVVEQARSNPDLIARLESHVTIRQSEYSTAGVLRAWASVLSRVPVSSPAITARERLAQGARAVLVELRRTPARYRAAQRMSG